MHQPPEHAAYLDEIEQRAAAATAGTWSVYDWGTLVEVVSDLIDTDTGYRCRRQIARLDEEPADNDPAHRDWTAEQDYAQLLADATFTAAARQDVPRLVALVREQYQHATAAHATLRARMQQVREFRVPLTNRLGGYAELTVERGPGPYDNRWAVTDGASFRKCAWIGGAWQAIADLGPRAVYRHGLEDALALADEAARVLGAAQDATLRQLDQDTPAPQEDAR